MKSKFQHIKTILLSVLLFYSPFVIVSAQNSCPLVTGAVAFGEAITGTSNCNFSISVDWVKQSANNVSLELVLLVDGSNEHDDGINCDIANITTPSGIGQTYNLPNTFIAPCNATIEINWKAKTNQSCGGGNCNEATTPALVSLPVELVGFNAWIDKANVVLEWLTVTEENNDYFAIEHSKDGRTFQEIGNIKGQGTSDIQQYYQFIDNTPLKGVNYYRLKQMDFDGSFYYSDIKTANFNTKGELIRVMPSPATNNLDVIFYKIFKKDAPVEVFDIMGHLILTQQLEEDSNEINIDISTLIPGQYFIRIRGERAFLIKRFIKVE